MNNNQSNYYSLKFLIFKVIIKMITNNYQDVY